jgi:hypothetical protein
LDHQKIMKKSLKRHSALQWPPVCTLTSSNGFPNLPNYTEDLATPAWSPYEYQRSWLACCNTQRSIQRIIHPYLLWHDTCRSMEASTGRRWGKDSTRDSTILRIDMTWLLLYLLLLSFAVL